MLFANLVLLAASAVDAVSGTSYPHWGWGRAVTTLLLLLPSLAVAVRRLHDTERSGWWLLLGLVPCVGPIVLIVMLVLSGTSGSNAYGAPSAT